MKRGNVFCSNCGQEMAGARFCANCGNAATESETPTATQDAPSQSAADNVIPDSYEPAWASSTGQSSSPDSEPVSTESAAAANSPVGASAAPLTVPTSSSNAPLTKSVKTQTTSPASPLAAAPKASAPVKPEFVSFGAAISRGFKQYAGFSGRAPRSEFWFWQLFLVLVSIAGSILFAISAVIDPSVGAIFFVLYSLVNLGLLLPTLAVTVRRIRDTGLSPWLIFLAFVPFLGGITILVFTLLNTDTVKK